MNTGSEGKQPLSSSHSRLSRQMQKWTDFGSGQSYGLSVRTGFRAFPGPGVRTMLSLPGAQVQSLAGKLGSC